MLPALHGEPHAVRMQLLAERGLLETVLQPVALGNLERGANPLVVGAKAHEPRGKRFVRAVAFARARERTVELEARPLRRPAHEATREQPESARARRMTAARPNHHGPDDIE